VGVVEGGTRSNVVPDEAHAEVDFRVTSPAETERLAAWARSLQPVLEGTTISARLTVNRPPMVRDEKMVSVFHRVQSIGKEIGLELREGSTGGGSDANFVAALGVPVLDGLGVVGDGAHAEHEHVQISSLPDRAALLAAILMGWE
jgi:glutamate carboxypeptidase